jgi:hypothetical protein
MMKLADLTSLSVIAHGGNPGPLNSPPCEGGAGVVGMVTLKHYFIQHIMTHGVKSVPCSGPKGRSSSIFY